MHYDSLDASTSNIMHIEEQNKQTEIKSKE